MLAGEPYRAADAELRAARLRARQLCATYNGSAPDQAARRLELLQELLAAVGTGIEIEPPFACDYGTNIRLGAGVFLNFGCVVLDCNRIEIGDQTLLGPGVHIYAAFHPTDPVERSNGLELSAPVTIGRNVWIGGHVVIGPGVQVGDDTTIGAGSVVMRSLPARVVAAGNPCRVIRQLEKP
jgi:maltose O-acetyltransferase